MLVAHLSRPRTRRSHALFRYRSLVDDLRVLATRRRGAILQSHHATNGWTLTSTGVSFRVQCFALKWSEIGAWWGEHKSKHFFIRRIALVVTRSTRKQFAMFISVIRIPTPRAKGENTQSFSHWTDLVLGEVLIKDHSPQTNKDFVETSQCLTQIGWTISASSGRITEIFLVEKVLQWMGCSNTRTCDMFERRIGVLWTIPTSRAPTTQSWIHQGFLPKCDLGRNQATNGTEAVAKRSWQPDSAAAKGERQLQRTSIVEGENLPWQCDDMLHIVENIRSRLKTATFDSTWGKAARATTYSQGEFHVVMGGETMALFEWTRVTHGLVACHGRQ